MKRLLTAFLAAILVCLLCSCGGGNAVRTERAQRKVSTGSDWTVLVYMCGGDMESEAGMASECLSEMMKQDYPENVNVVVQTGGSAEWQTEGIYPEYMQRFEVQNGSLYLADQKAAVNMGDYKNFEDFLSWGAMNYPAEKYMAIIWNHGGGTMTGAAFDELYGNDSLNLEEISYAVSLTGINFDVIGFDASLMSTIEVASAIAPYAHYMIASEEYAPECWDYSAAVSCLINYPNADVGEICKYICNSAYEKYTERGVDGIASLAVLDLSKISELSQAFEGMAGDMLTASDSLANMAHLKRDLMQNHVYGANSPSEGYTNTVDLGALATAVKEDTGETSDTLMSAINDTVIYNVNGIYHEGASGLGVFYPLSGNPADVEAYLGIASGNNYKSYLMKTTVIDGEETEGDYHSSWAWQDYMSETSMFNAETYINEDGYYELIIGGNMDTVNSIGADLWYYYKDDCVYLGTDKNPDSQWDMGLFTYLPQKTIQLNGRAVTADFVGMGGKYMIYSIPVLLNGETSHIRAAYNPEDKKYTVIGAWSGIDASSGKAARGIHRMNMGDRVTPLLRTQTGSYVTGSGMLIGPLGAKTAEKNIKNGSYIVKYNIESIYGDSMLENSAEAESNASGVRYISFNQ